MFTPFCILHCIDLGMQSSHTSHTDYWAISMKFRIARGQGEGRESCCTSSRQGYLRSAMLIVTERQYSLYWQFTELTSSARDKNSLRCWELGCLFSLSLSSSLPTPNFQKRKWFHTCYSITLGTKLKANVLINVIYLVIQTHSTNKIQLISTQEHSLCSDIPCKVKCQDSMGHRESAGSSHLPACNAKCFSSFIFTTSRGCEISCVGNHPSSACAILSLPVN